MSVPAILSSISSKSNQVAQGAAATVQPAFQAPVDFAARILGTKLSSSGSVFSRQASPAPDSDGQVTQVQQRIFKPIPIIPSAPIFPRSDSTPSLPESPFHMGAVTPSDLSFAMPEAEGDTGIVKGKV